MSGLSSRLREQRHALRMSQAEIAELAGCSASAYCDLERGKTARSQRIGEIAAALRTTVEYLQTGHSGAPGRTPGTVPLLDKGSVLAFMEDRLSDLSTSDRAVLIPVHHASDRAFAVRVDDESMAPDLLPGHIAYVDPAVDRHSGDVCLLHFVGDRVPVIRKLTTDGNVMYAQTSNSGWPGPLRQFDAVPDLYCEPLSDCGSFSRAVVVGKVICLVRPM